MPVLGTLTLTGRIRALEPGEGTEQIAEYRLNHADCGPACGEPASTVVALELTAIELTDPQHLEAEWIPLDDYQSAELDRVVAEAYVVAAHLNEHHAEDLLRLAGLLTSGHPEILAAAIQSVDRAGLVLTVINSSGAHDLDLTFRFPVTSVGDLGSQLHHLLEDPTAYLRA